MIGIFITMQAGENMNTPRAINYALQGLDDVHGPYGIWLDDVRNPPSYTLESFSWWVVCRSINEAIQVVNQLGWPSFVSFDHDLGNEVPTGMDFAHWLVNRDMEYKDMPPGWSYRVHSMNPIGKENIHGLLKGYLTVKSNN